MFLKQDQSDQAPAGERKLSAKDREAAREREVREFREETGQATAAGERKLSARGHELQQFSGADAWDQYGAWNQRRQLRGKL